MGVNDKAPLLRVEGDAWLQALRNVTRATDERTVFTSALSVVPVGHSAHVVELGYARALASCLLQANLNSLILDWAARLSVGGTNMSFFIVKQLPVLPPETYLEPPPQGVAGSYLDLVLPRAFELTYTSHELDGFARDLGHDGPPFRWDEHRRHCLKSELDAIYAHMYGLTREEVLWILDAPPPSTSFPGLKQKEEDCFGEYRTKRLVLRAWDELVDGALPRVS